MAANVAEVEHALDDQRSSDLPRECADLIQALRSDGELGIESLPLPDQRESFRAGGDAATPQVGLTEEELADEASAVAGPLLPIAWVNRALEVIPDGLAKAGRPRVKQPGSKEPRLLSVQDLDSYVSYVQRRTRHVQDVTRRNKPNCAQASELIKTTIQDSIRRLAMLLPTNQRAAIEESISSSESCL